MGRGENTGVRSSQQAQQASTRLRILRCSGPLPEQPKLLAGARVSGGDRWGPQAASSADRGDSRDPQRAYRKITKGYSDTLLVYGIPNPGYPTMLFECASKNSFYICIVIPARKDSSPGTRSRSPPWPSMIFRTEESPIP